MIAPSEQPDGKAVTSLTTSLNDLAERLSERGLLVATAESCTGGGIAYAMTELAGASRWFDRGFVTYSNEAKAEQLDVAAETLKRHGAVSEPVVLEMALGALAHSRAALSVAVSGVAGPGGGSPDKPVGTVWIAWADTESGAAAQCFLFPGDRHAVRQATIVAAIQGLVARLDSSLL